MSSPARNRQKRARRRLVDAARCPDCNSEVQITSDDPQTPQLTVGHDPTCPSYRSRGGLPHRQLIFGRWPA